MSRENYNTLWSHVQCIPDPRNLRGRRYEWAYILTLLAAAMLAGQKSILAMSQWATSVMPSARSTVFFTPQRHYAIAPGFSPEALQPEPRFAIIHYCKGMTADDWAHRLNATLSRRLPCFVHPGGSIRRFRGVSEGS